MKKQFITLLCLWSMIFSAQAQEKQTYVNSKWKMGKLFRMVPNGIPKWDHDVHSIPSLPTIYDPNGSDYYFQEGNQASKGQKTNAITVQVKRNFEGNHLYGRVPADNAMAISDSGLIVSIDNATIAYFKENGDTVVKYGLPHSHWYQDTTLDQDPFDPRVIYDREADRFIAVMAYFSQDYKDARVLVSFSQPLGTDSVSWYHYQLPIDSIYTDLGESLFWADFPSIAINKDELFIGLNIFDYDSISGNSSFEETLVLQIDKTGGYVNSPQLDCKEWLSVKNADGFDAGTIKPIGESFQDPGYGPGCYFLSNYLGNSTKFFWYELDGDLNDPSATLTSTLTATSFFYSHPSYASQPGGNGADRIRFGDCRIQSGLYQNGKLHFVLHRSDNGWGELVYANINLSNNTFFADTWGGEEDTLNCMYPSIAPFGKDSTEENFLIAFLRTGPTVFPEICVINYDAGWSAEETVVKQGLGIIDQRDEFAAPWDSLERIGDYIDIQRRYNDPENACWIGASYAAGPLPNHFGVRDGINTWIAEVADSVGVSVPEAIDPIPFIVYPNPQSGDNPILRVILSHLDRAGEYFLLNSIGEVILNTKYSSSSFTIRLPKLPKGLYFVVIKSNKYHYEPQKIIIVD